MAALSTALVLLFGISQLHVWAATDNVRDLCYVGQREMYHSYPGDASRYIQCNKFGRSFVRHCNSGHTWSQALRTCVTGSVTTDIKEEHMKKREPAKTYPAHDKQVATSYIRKVPIRQDESAYFHPLLKKQYHNWQYISPNRYMYKKLAAKPSFAYDYSYGVKPKYRKSATGSSASKTLRYRLEKRNPYQYYYSSSRSGSRFTPKTFSSTVHGTGSKQVTHTGNAYPFMRQARARSLRQGESRKPTTNYGVHGKRKGVLYKFGTDNSMPKTRYTSSSFVRQTSNTAYNRQQAKPIWNSYQRPAYKNAVKNPIYSGTGRQRTYFNIRQNPAYRGTGQYSDYGTYVHGSKQSKSQQSQQPAASKLKMYSNAYSDATSRYYQKPQSKTNRPSYSIASQQYRNHGVSYGIMGQTNQRKNDQSHQAKTPSTSYGTADSYQRFKPYKTAQTPSPSMAYNYYGGVPYQIQRIAQTSSPYGNGHNAYIRNNVDTSYHRLKGKSVRVGGSFQSRPTYTSVAQQPRALPTTRCSHGSPRYLPDHTDENSYYECISQFKMVSHKCGKATVWVQPLRMCVDVNDGLSLNVPTSNPCAGTDARYKAYPMDPSKYIECRTWYSVFVWSCKEQQMWVEEQHKCLNIGTLQPVGPEPEHHKQNMHTHPPQPRLPAPKPPADTSNPCDNTTFHFAFPGDDTKFIQCDEFGHAFTRPCASTSLWNDEIKTCAKNLGVQPERVPAVQVNSDRYNYDFSNAQPLNIKDEEVSWYDAEGSYQDGKGQYSDVRGDAKTYIYNNVESSYTSTDADEKQCEDGDLWVLSLRLCASMKDAKLKSDFCHSGDYYFPDYHVCASIRYSDIEGKSFTQNTTYDTTHDTNYDYETQDTVSSNRCAAEYKEYTGMNPCGINDTYYYEFPLDASCFIQCNQLNNMYIMTCSVGSMWNQDAGQCVHNNQDDYEFNDDYTSNDDNSNNLDSRGSNLGAHFSADYPQETKQSGCEDTSDTSYKRHPGNVHRFIMCINKVGYPMWCPHTNLWRQDMQTCFWPSTH